MAITLTGLLRITALAGLILLGTALGLARLVPDDDRRARGRYAVEASHLVVPTGFYREESRLPVIYQVGTSRSEELLLPDGELLDHLSLSPWSEPDGARQIVGRWMTYSGRGVDRLSRQFGLARFSYPDLRPIDRIETDLIPACTPCWFPGTQAGILFPGGDGQVYRFEFEPAEGTASPDSPEPIRWEVEGLDPRDTIVQELNWPRDPRFGGRLLASICRVDPRNPSGPPVFSPPQLWWFQVDSLARTIVAGERIEVGPIPESGRTVEHHRFPTLQATPDGGILLAYLARTSPSDGWDLRVVPIRLDSRTGAPMAEWERTRTLAADCLPNAPAFSGDGRTIVVLTRTTGAVKPRIRRVPVLPPHPGVLAARSVFHSSSRPF